MSDWLKCFFGFHDEVEVIDEADHGWFPARSHKECRRCDWSDESYADWDGTDGY